MKIASLIARPNNASYEKINSKVKRRVEIFPVNFPGKYYPTLTLRK
jgi:hypothetical protein